MPTRTKPLASLLTQLPPEVVADARLEAARQQPTVATLVALQALRKRRGVSQEALARALGVKQAAVSRLERRSDMYVSTLKDLIAALGGELRIIARFPEGDCELGPFEGTPTEPPGS